MELLLGASTKNGGIAVPTRKNSLSREKLARLSCPTADKSVISGGWASALSTGTWEEGGAGVLEISHQLPLSWGAA